MIRSVRSWKVAAFCALVVGFTAASSAVASEVWDNFAVGQAGFQVAEDPFEEEPSGPKEEPAPEEPAQVIPPDPAYQVPLPGAQQRPVRPPTPLVPPKADTPPSPVVPPPPFVPEADGWQPGCGDYGCGLPSDGCGPDACSPFGQWTRDTYGHGMPGFRRNGLPLGIRWEGWIAQGVTLNTRSPRNRSNSPVTFNDGSNEYQMNQLYLVAERAVRDDDWSVGGRVDFLYGTDHRYTMARGLEVNRDLSPKWNREEYGLALPQAYAEVFAPVGTGVNVRAGHFYTILGYEAVAAPENFFYSHAYTMQYGEPFTHTGVLAATDVGPLKLQAGVTRGWDNWENNNDEYGFLGAVGWTSDDERTALAFALHTGPEEGLLSPDTNERTTYSLVFSHNLHGPWSCVVQHDMGIDRRAMRDGSDATWYGLNMYLFREITEQWKFGYRFEWFRDDDGTRVIEGLAADYYQMSWGLNYSPSDRVRIRPSVRWDWIGARGARPFADGTRDDQLLLDCDVLIMF